MNITELSEKVLKYRAANNLTQKELARKIGGLSNHTIMNIEKQKGTVRQITMFKVQNFLEKNEQKG